MTTAADAPRDRDDHNDNLRAGHRMDPWVDYVGYPDADGLFTITHCEQPGEWIASSVTETPPDRADLFDE